jgi:hypothetical protein
MADTDIIGLESSIKELPGVLGCVVLSNPDGSPAEIQAFTAAGTPSEEIERSIQKAAVERGFGATLGQVFVLALEARSHLGNEETMRRAAELAEQEARSRGPLGVLHALGTLHSLAESDPDVGPGALPSGRPPLRRVVLASSTWTSEAEVVLGPPGHDVVGRASGEKTPHGLKVIAEATLNAARQLLSACELELAGASLISCFGREAVIVLVTEETFGESLGSALVRNAPVTEAAVRATLDAVNRRLAVGR